MNGLPIAQINTDMCAPRVRRFVPEEQVERLELTHTLGMVCIRPQLARAQGRYLEAEVLE